MFIQERLLIENMHAAKHIENYILLLIKNIQTDGQANLNLPIALDRQAEKVSYRVLIKTLLYINFVFNAPPCYKRKLFYN